MWFSCQSTLLWDTQSKNTLKNLPDLLIKKCNSPDKTGLPSERRPRGQASARSWKVIVLTRPTALWKRWGNGPTRGDSLLPRAAGASSPRSAPTVPGAGSSAGPALGRHLALAAPRVGPFRRGSAPPPAVRAQVSQDQVKQKVHPDVAARPGPHAPWAESCWHWGKLPLGFPAPRGAGTGS